VQVLFEIGHEATIRTKRTPEGFTHDWEVFVRGADNTEINHFVDKVVFHLHETFPKPKRGKLYTLNSNLIKAA
jgi:YEATS domain-containing protein 1/3